MVKLETSMGDIFLELDEEKAPKSVENFLAYVNDGHYDGTIFHRVIDGFMIQGGGFTEDMQQKPTKDPIVNEADNMLKKRRVYRCHGPDTGSGQCHEPVLHQCEKERFPESHRQDSPRVGICGIRKGRQRPRRRQ